MQFFDKNPNLFIEFIEFKKNNCFYNIFEKKRRNGLNYLGFLA